MAIINEDTKVKISGDGATTEFSFDFKIYAKTDLKVWLVDKTSGDIDEKSLTADYKVTLNRVDEGGVIEFVTLLPPSSDVWVFMFSDMAYTQNVVLPTDGAFRERKVSNGLDRLCRLIQQNKEAIERSLKMPIQIEKDVEFPIPEAKTYIAWNDAGDDLVNRLLPDPSILERATQTEAETGTDNEKYITSLRAKQAIDINAIDIVDNLTSTDTDKALSANQGKELKTDIDAIQTVPSGGIILWSGAISAIPSGYVLCDGTNGTPNLTDRFVIHADADSGGTNDVGDTGGSRTISVAQMPAHTHTEDHQVDGGVGTSYGHAGWSVGNEAAQASGSTGGGEDFLPKYYALAYIMKT